MSSQLSTSIAQEAQQTRNTQDKERTMLSKTAKWLALWVVANIIGFSLGELVGGRTGLFGLIGNLRGIDAGWWWMVGCLPYGFLFGLCEKVLMQPSPANRLHPGYPTFWQTWSWPIASAVGYAIGIGFGEKFTYGLVPNPIFLGPVFGLFVGLFLGIAQAIALQGQCAHSWRWVPACVLVWVIGEWAAFVLGFQFRSTPIVGAVIGTVSGLMLLWLCPRLAQLK